MNFIGIIFAVVSVLVVFAVVDADPTEKSCQDVCGDEDFDEVVCAFNGEELRHFSGRCRLQQYNECHNDCELIFSSITSSDFMTFTKISQISKKSIIKSADKTKPRLG